MTQKLHLLDVRDGHAVIDDSELVVTENVERDERGRFSGLVDTHRRLDRDKLNIVHLSDMRAAHPELSRGQFDAALQDARRRGALSLSAADRATRDMDAGIQEDNSLLLYAHRRL